MAARRTEADLHLHGVRSGTHPGPACRRARARRGRGARPRWPGRHRPGRGARARRRPPGREALECHGHRGGPGEGPRLRPRQARALRRRIGRDLERSGPSRGSDRIPGGDGGLHVPRAGEGSGGGRAQRRLLPGRRTLRAPGAQTSLRGRDRHGSPGRRLAPRTSASSSRGVSRPRSRGAADVVEGPRAALLQHGRGRRGALRGAPGRVARGRDGFHPHRGRDPLHQHHRPEGRRVAGYGHRRDPDGRPQASRRLVPGFARADDRSAAQAGGAGSARGGASLESGSRSGGSLRGQRRLSAPGRPDPGDCARHRDHDRSRGRHLEGGRAHGRDLRAPRPHRGRGCIAPQDWRGPAPARRERHRGSRSLRGLLARPRVPAGGEPRVDRPGPRMLRARDLAGPGLCAGPHAKRCRPRGQGRPPGPPRSLRARAREPARKPPSFDLRWPKPGASSGPPSSIRARTRLLARSSGP